LQAHAFASLPSFFGIGLNLTQQRIGHIEPFAFSGLISQPVVDLSFNKLTSLSNHTFEGMLSLNFA
jgi:hypothetical protein